MMHHGPWRFGWLGSQVGFAKPMYLFLVLGVILVAGISVRSALLRRKRLNAVVSSRMANTLAQGVSTLRPLVQALLNGLGLLLFVVALAQPQCAAQAEISRRKGVDVVVALDASKSMYAQDVQPSRLERAKLELSTLLDSLKGDRVAIVTFAADAFTQCPLTSDYAAAKMFLRAVNPDDMPQGGTNIGEALLLSRQVLDNADRGAKERVVILLSDGEELLGDLDEGLASLKEANVTVLTVGIGNESGEPIPILDKQGNKLGFKRDSDGEIVLSRLNRKVLEDIASETGGQFFYAPQGVAMDQVAQVIDRMQKSDLEGRVNLRYAEGFQYFVALGLVFQLLGVWMRVSQGRPT